MNRTVANCISSVLLIAIVLGLYYPTVSFEFAYDDILHIQHNPLVNQAANFTDTVSKTLTTATPPGDLYRPLATLSYRINFIYSGLNAADFHLTNVFIYALCCILVFLTCLVLGKSTFCQVSNASSLNVTALSFAIAMIFAVHPIHVEAVANIVGRAELLACLCGLSALNCFILAFNVRSARFFLLPFLTGGLLYFLALLAKESALTFIFIIPLALWYTQGSQNYLLKRRRLLWLCVLLITASLLMLLLRYQALNGELLINFATNQINPENSLAYFNSLESALHAFRILGDYILLVFAPFKLSADYTRMPERVFADTYSALGLVSLFAVAAYTLFVFSLRKQAVFFWGAWFFISFLLTANIFTKIGTIMAERLLFTPSIGVISFISIVLYQSCQQTKYRRSLLSIFALCTMLLFSYLTQERIPIWRNNQTLFAQTLLDAPSSPKALYNYGVYLRTDKNDLNQSEHFFLETLKIIPTHTLSMIALADIALEKKNYARVEYWYHRILTLDPENNAVKDNLSSLLKYKENL